MVEVTKRSIYQKIYDVQHECESVVKDKKGQMQYRPTSHNSVAAVVRPALKKHGLIILPSIRESEQTGNQTRCILDARIVDVDSGEELQINGFFGYGNDAQDKGPGKSMSYAFKYLLLKLFLLNVSDEEDSEKTKVNQEILTIGAKEISKPQKEKKKMVFTIFNEKNEQTGQFTTFSEYYAQLKELDETALNEEKNRQELMNLKVLASNPDHYKKEGFTEENVKLIIEKINALAIRLEV